MNISTHNYYLHLIIITTYIHCPTIISFFQLLFSNLLYHLLPLYNLFPYFSIVSLTSAPFDSKDTPSYIQANYQYIQNEKCVYMELS